MEEDWDQIKNFAQDLFAYLIELRLSDAELPRSLFERSEGSPFNEDIGYTAFRIWEEFKTDFVEEFYRDFPRFARSRAEFETYAAEFAMEILTKGGSVFRCMLIASAFILELAAFCFENGCKNFVRFARPSWIEIFKYICSDKFFAKGGWEELQRRSCLKSKKRYFLAGSSQMSPINYGISESDKSLQFQASKNKHFAPHTSEEDKCFKFQTETSKSIAETSEAKYPANEMGNVHRGGSTENQQQTKSTDSLQQTESVENVLKTDSVENVLQTESAEVRQTKSVANLQLPESAVNLQLSESAANLQLSESVVNLPLPESVANLQLSDSMVNLQQAESMVNVQRVKSMVNLQRVESMVNLQRVESMVNLPRLDPVPNLHRAKSMANLQGVKSTESLYKLAESTESLYQSESSASIHLPGSTESIYFPQSMESIHLLQSMESISLSQSMENIPPYQSLKSISLPQSTKSVSIPESMESLYLIGLTENLHLVESTESVSLPESVENIPQCEASGGISVTESKRSKCIEAMYDILLTNEKGNKYLAAEIEDKSLDSTTNLESQYKAAEDIFLTDTTESKIQKETEAMEKSLQGAGRKFLPRAKKDKSQHKYSEVYSSSTKMYTADQFLGELSAVAANLASPRKVSASNMGSGLPEVNTRHYAIDETGTISEAISSKDFSDKNASGSQMQKEGITGGKSRQWAHYSRRKANISESKDGYFKHATTQTEAITGSCYQDAYRTPSFGGARPKQRTATKFDSDKDTFPMAKERSTSLSYTVRKPRDWLTNKPVSSKDRTEKEFLSSGDIAEFNLNTTGESLECSGLRRKACAKVLNPPWFPTMDAVPVTSISKTLIPEEKEYDDDLPVFGVSSQDTRGQLDECSISEFFKQDSVSLSQISEVKPEVLTQPDSRQRKKANQGIETTHL